ncbi:hypothetical protein DSS3P8_133 [Roseobacter phage DSS3P8]|nr:hypothetical protein DSS3P8_133 [Roseobacter phage DSS3P8]
MSVSMTHENHIDFEIHPFTYVGSTIGNAFHSGLSLEDVYAALLVAEDARAFDNNVNELIFERFDNAVSATIRLKEITKEST